MRINGVYSVLPTPFRADRSLDLDSLRRVVELYIHAGVHGLTTLGVTSEVAWLTECEREEVLGAVVAFVNGRVPVVVGTSADALPACIQFSKRAKSTEAAAVMVSPPRMEARDSEGVFAHFAHLASAVDIEIVVQDYPSVSGVAMDPSLLARIAREIPRARTIKLEDPPTPAKTMRIREIFQGEEINIMGGLGGVYLFEELLAGAAGVMTGFAYPEMLVEVVKLFSAGDVRSAADAFYSYVPLMRFEFQQGIGTTLRKEILRRRGAIADPVVRTPGGELDPVALRALDSLLRWMWEKQRVRWISD